MTYIKYLKALLRHKWFVFLASIKLGVPFLGIIHDWSKFLPNEFIAYARSFYGPHAYDDRPDSVVTAFDYAWNTHQKRNKHHWQYWILTNDELDGMVRNTRMKMPERYVREMVADWIGAGRAYGNPDTRGWYLSNDAIRLHPESTLLVHKLLGIKSKMVEYDYGTGAIEIEKE
jgi:hypothetical protein